MITKKTGLIYLISNNINNKCYVGQTTQKLEKRWQGHITDSRRKKTLFSRAIKKHGVKNFIITTIETVNSMKELNELEAFFIKKFNTLKPFGYNLDSGGGNFWRHPSTGKKISEAKKGQTPWNKNIPCSKETKQKISNSNKGRVSPMKEVKMSEETKKKISITKKGIVSPLKGIKKSKETKKRMSIAMKGRKGNPHTEEFKRKLSKRNIGNKHGLGHKRTTEEKTKMRIFAIKRLRDKQGRFINLNKNI